MKVLDIIRKARKTYRDSMNKIEVIRVIREARPDVDLKGAKDFWEWIDRNGDELSAPRLACHWCVEHWQDNEICGCPEGVEVVAEESELQGKGDAANGGSRTQSKAAAVSASPVTCGFMTTVGVCGHPTVEGKCRFIYHNPEQRQ